MQDAGSGSCPRAGTMASWPSAASQPVQGHSLHACKVEVQPRPFPHLQLGGLPAQPRPAEHSPRSSGWRRQRRSCHLYGRRKVLSTAHAYRRQSVLLCNGVTGACDWQRRCYITAPSTSNLRQLGPWGGGPVLWCSGGGHRGAGASNPRASPSHLAPAPLTPQPSTSYANVVACSAGKTIARD